MMEFTVDRAALQKELSLLQGVVERKNTIPVLANVMLEASTDGVLRISGTDLDISLRTEITEVDVKTAGSMCIQARKTFDVVRMLSEPTVSFKKLENEWVSAESGKAKYKLPGVDPTSFPELPKALEVQAKIAASILRQCIERTLFAITQEEGRYTLSGAKLELDKELKMVTTDGHRLAYVELGSVDAPTKVDVLVPRKTLAELMKLTVGFDGDVEIGADYNHVTFRCGTREVTSRLLSGQFPNYEMVLPKNNDRVIELQTSAFHQALQRATLMADDRSHAIKLVISRDQVLIMAQHQDAGEAREIVPAVYAAEDVEIGFNSHYLTEFLTAVKAETVLFEFKDGNSQAQIRPAEEEALRYKYVIMPMRL